MRRMENQIIDSLHHWLVMHLTNAEKIEPNPRAV